MIDHLRGGHAASLYPNKPTWRNPVIINQEHLLLKAPIKGMLSTKERLNSVSHGLAEVGYDIRLKQSVWFGQKDQTTVLESPGSTRATISDGNFCLASAIEEFDMPDDLAAIVHDKSTWARHGLSVFNTVIDPGWKGFLTLELVYHGSKPLHIPAGSGIAQVIFHEIKRPISYNGSYQHQDDRPVGPCNNDSV